MKRHLLKTLVIALICVAWSTHCLAQWYNGNESNTRYTNESLGYTVEFAFTILQSDHKPNGEYQTPTAFISKINSFTTTAAFDGTFEIPFRLPDPKDPEKSIEVVRVALNQIVGGNSIVSGVTKIKIQEGCTDIAGLPYNGFTNCTTLEIPASVTNISGSALANLSNLETLTIDGNNPKYKSIGRTLYQKVSGHDDQYILVIST